MAWQARRSSAANPRCADTRNSIMVGALRFSAPARTRTQHRPHTPTPPHELPIGTLARRAASSTVSFAIASAALHNGVNVTRIRTIFASRDETFGACRRLYMQDIGGIQ